MSCINLNIFILFLFFINSISSSDLMLLFDKESLGLWTDLDLMMAINLDKEEKERFLPELQKKLKKIYLILMQDRSCCSKHTVVFSDYVQTRLDEIKYAYDLVFTETVNNKYYNKINKIFRQLENLH